MTHQWGYEWYPEPKERPRRFLHHRPYALCSPVSSTGRCPTVQPGATGRMAPEQIDAIKADLHALMTKRSKRVEHGLSGAPSCSHAAVMVACLDNACDAIFDLMGDLQPASSTPIRKAKTT